jgi:hypothetical protein
MKIAVCSLYINPWYRDIVKYGKKSMEIYCAKHGYDFIWETEDTIDGVYDGSRPIPWFKILLLLKVMDKEYDFIVWNDADSQILDYDTKLESFIENDLGNRDILVAKDWMSTLNTGTMFIRNCTWSRDMLTFVWNNKSLFDPSLHEQASFGDLYTRNVMSARDRVVVLPLESQNKFLTYWYSYIPGRCFIFHATRCSHDRLGFIFTMDMFCTVKMDEETDEQYRDRMNWLHTDRCLQDIVHYQNGGQRRNLSARYIAALRGATI